MARSDINRFAEMDVFVRVVEEGGFSRAARVCRLTPSAVSKLIARMEDRLGARLFNRSTRRLILTAEGCAFYDRATRILSDLADAERTVGAGETPAGPLRINTSGAYAAHVLIPALPAFLARYPGLTVDIDQTDAVVDLMAARADVAIRTGPLKASNLVARKLGETPLRLVAAPTYLAGHGVPETVADLDRHVRLGFGYVRAVDGWPLVEDGREVLVGGPPRVTANDGVALLRMALAGVGIARLADFMTRTDLAAGRLVPVLPAQDPGERESFYAIFADQGGPLPARVRALLDFLAVHGRVS